MSIQYTSERLDHTHAVFCDVDDTIIRDKSLLSFARMCPWGAAELAPLIRMQQQGVSRSELNRMYYQRMLGGRSVQTITHIAAKWYSEHLGKGDFFRAEVLQILERYRSDGVDIVLASGSFDLLLWPIAKKLGATGLISAPLEVLDNVFSGQMLSAPTIGEGKREAVHEYAKAHGYRLSRCVGIGDDESDFPFLSDVGTVHLPTNSHPVLLDAAKERGWQILSPIPSSQAEILAARECFELEGVASR